MSRQRSLLRLSMEHLENRQMLTATLFLDFGGGVGFDSNGQANTLLHSDGSTPDVEDYRDIFGPGLNGLRTTGPDLTRAIVPQSLSSSVEFQPLSYDFNNDGVLDATDINSLAAAVVPFVERIVEPFDLDVVVSQAASLNDISPIVAANETATNGNKNAYVFVGAFFSDFFSGGSVGINQSIAGIAAGDDLAGQNGNLQDEAAFVISDVIQNDVSGSPGTSPFNDALARSITRIAVHEAFHTFAYFHSGGILALDDVIRISNPAATRDQPTIITRAPILDLRSTVAEPNNYELAKQVFGSADNPSGLRDDDGDGIPNLAYVTGTGAEDLIELTADANDPDLVNVVVKPFFPGGEFDPMFQVP